MQVQDIQSQASPKIDVLKPHNTPIIIPQEREQKSIHLATKVVIIVII